MGRDGDFLDVLGLRTDFVGRVSSIYFDFFRFFTYFLDFQNILKIFFRILEVIKKFDEKRIKLFTL